MVMVPIRRGGSVCALSAAATANPRSARRTDFTGCFLRVADWAMTNRERVHAETRRGGEKRSFICYPARHTNPGGNPLDSYRGGWIEIIAGGMFSGKSEELIRRLRRAVIARQR